MARPIALAVGGTALAAVIVAGALLAPLPVVTGSMKPAVRSGDWVLVEKHAYRTAEPVRGDVVLFVHPDDAAKSYLKRVVGLPGETVALVGGEVRVDGEALDDPWSYCDDAKPLFSEGSWCKPHAYFDDIAPVKVPAESYYVLGDNRHDSLDSRSFVTRPTVPHASLEGRAWRILWAKNRSRIGQRVR